MRIIFIPGINTPSFYLSPWRKELEESFPDHEIIFLYRFYHHFEYSKMAGMIKDGVEILKNGAPTKILAHSFGGMLAKKIISESPNHQVERLATMATPHKMKAFGVARARKKMEIPDQVSIPTATFGGRLDLVVPFRYTKTDNSQHENLWCEHASFLWLPKVREKVLAKF